LAYRLTLDLVQACMSQIVPGMKPGFGHSYGAFTFPSKQGMLTKLEELKQEKVIQPHRINIQFTLFLRLRNVLYKSHANRLLQY
jgi:hypothetical protein